MHRHLNLRFLGKRKNRIYRGVVILKQAKHENESSTEDVTRSLYCERAVLKVTRSISEGSNVRPR
jgi:hypothetical protein